MSFSWLRGWAGRTCCAFAIFVFLILNASLVSARNAFLSPIYVRMPRKMIML